MYTLVNKTARVVNIDNLILIPGVSRKVGDIAPLLSLYPRFKDMVESGEIVVKTQAAKPAAVEKAPAPKERPETPAEIPGEEPVDAEEKPKRTRRKKE